MWTFGVAPRSFAIEIGNLQIPSGYRLALAPFLMQFICFSWSISIQHDYDGSVVQSQSSNVGAPAYHGGEMRLAAATHDSSEIWVDCDAGTDDAWALFMLLVAHQNPSNPIKIVGISCVHGNTNVDNVGVNVNRVLQTMNATDIPVYKGAESAFTIGYVEVPPYNGKDGFGDADLPLLSANFRQRHAVSAIIKSLKESREGTLTILALGPLTNLALALRISPQIHNLPKEIIILGGNYLGSGLSSPAAEFNFISDAESARTVLENFSCPMTVVPFETWWNFGATPHGFRTNVLGATGTPQIALLNKIEAKILQNNTKKWGSPDAMAAAIFINSAVVTKEKEYYCTVELQGSLTRGMMVVDHFKQLGKQPNIKIVEKINTIIYKEILMATAGYQIN